MDSYKLIDDLLDKKKSENLNEEEKEACFYIEELLNNKDYFFSIDIDVLGGILIFLGIENESEKIIKDLLSIENYNKYVSKQRVIINPKE